MPHPVSREEALERRGPPGACRLCARVDGELDVSRGDVLHEERGVAVLLSRYPVRWGQLMVVPRLHVERFVELPLELWLTATRLAHGAARTLEMALRPSRCYIVSLGAERSDLPMTFPHVHINVIPVPDPDSRPRDVLSWQRGVLDGTEGEWTDLRRTLRARWLDELSDGAPPRSS